MFGVLRPNLKCCSHDIRCAYQCVYCNICGHLKSSYGLKARMLVIYDFATMAWLLLESTINFPFSRRNCLIGGRSGEEKSQLFEFLASMSAYTCMVKTKDNMRDGRGFKTRFMERLYRSTFSQSASMLAAEDFPVS